MEPLWQIARKIERVASFGKLHLLALKHSRELELRQDNLDSIRPNAIILFSVMKNEARRLPFFVEYYRKLGVDHFVFVDNNSTDEFADYVAGQRDISTFHTTASYKNAHFGVHWLNYLLSSYGSGHWCLTCDPDEFLVYPKMDTRRLRELTAHLDASKSASLFTLMVDMYGESSVQEATYLVGQDPLEVCPYFDRVGYNKDLWEYYAATAANGGVRRRVFFTTCPERAPALNKVPLVKWERHFVYALSTHVARPNRINDVCAINDVSGALLHFKFISDLKHKVEEEKVANQHWDNSFEYERYDEALRQRSRLFDPEVSVRYDSWHDLAELGLINPGDW